MHHEFETKVGSNDGNIRNGQSCGRLLFHSMFSEVTKWLGLIRRLVVFVADITDIITNTFNIEPLEKEIIQDMDITTTMDHPWKKHTSEDVASFNDPSIPDLDQIMTTSASKNAKHPYSASTSPIMVQTEPLHTYYY